MKLSLSLVYFNVMAVAAASQLFCLPRGFPDCQDGEGDALFTIHSSPRGCIKACYLEEQMENDNHGKRCKGQCKSVRVDHQTYNFACHGRNPDYVKET
ncbi:hypothetical protein FPOAC1_003709 [Fusarium poae]|uniref:hypothetical protein n=1 Tax=Fusarium poae TaxID=36050 RepID=UPI001CEA9D85|nr:hypothetical protein FPOAC1_003709 [Fusarium poae]KAG8677682.1 hypothetical protein FPOAC1_003709 [Fusarium poae]